MTKFAAVHTALAAMLSLSRTSINMSMHFLGSNARGSSINGLEQLVSRAFGDIRGSIGAITSLRFSPLLARLPFWVVDLDTIFL